MRVGVHLTYFVHRRLRQYLSSAGYSLSFTLFLCQKDNTNDNDNADENTDDNENTNTNENDNYNTNDNENIKPVKLVQLLNYNKMRKIHRFILTFAMALCSMAVLAQNGFNYQAVIRDENGNLLVNHKIALRITLLNGDNSLYQEQQTLTTNAYGAISVVVGTGTILSGTSFANVPWSNGNISMRTEFNPDPDNSSTFDVIGTTLLQSVPFAEYAKTTGEVENPTNIKIQATATTGDEEALFEVKDNEGKVVFAVYKNGVRVYVDDTDNGGKAAKSGFAVTGRKAKDGEASTYFAVDNYGTQVYVDDEGSDKAAKAKFAVTSVKKGKDGDKAEVENYLVVNKQGTQVYVDGDESSDKAAKAKFAVTSVKKGKATTEDNVFVINEEGTNVFVDDQSDGKAAKAKFAVTSVKKGKDGESLADNYLVVNDEGTKVYVDGEDSKAAKAKFAVTSVRSGKAEEADDFFLINKDGTKVFIDEEAQGKAAKAKFAVTSVKKGKDGENAGNSDYMLIDSDSTRIYIDETGNAKAAKSGFAVTGKSANKAGNKNLFNIDLTQTAETINDENRVYWYPKKNAFLVGKLQVDSAAQVGENSFNAGYQNKAIGNYSQALGYQSIATGQSSFACGNSAKATGNSSAAFGARVYAKGNTSYAFGVETIAKGDHSIAIGSEATSIGNSTVAIGCGTIAKSYCETAMGALNTNYTPIGGRFDMNTNDKLFVIGNGYYYYNSETHKLDTMRSDALIVYKSGNMTVNGTITHGGLVGSSDIRLKKDIQPLNGALDKILQLRGVSFYWKNKEEMAAAKGKDVNNFSYGFGPEKQIGVIAQEIEKVVPELVVTDNDGFKAVKYENLTPLLIEAIKEQNNKIEELEAKLKEMDELKKLVEELLKKQ